MIFPNPPTIFKTTNYGLFSKIAWNRDLNKANVEKLVNLTKNKFQMHKFPIVVNEEMEIIDGQHRFEASKTLNAPIYYVVDNERTATDREKIKAVQSVNTAGKRHNLHDKVLMLNNYGDPGARFIMQTYLRYGEQFDLTTVAKALTAIGGGHINRMVENMEIVLKNKEKGLQCLEALDEARINDWSRSKCVVALCRLVFKYNINPYKLVNKVKNEAQHIYGNPRTSIDTYQKLIDVYNYRLNETNRIMR